MKQKTILDNDCRNEPIIYDAEKKIYLKENESKEYVTKSGAIVTVVKKKKHLQGVSLYPIVFFQLNDCGKIIEPLQSIG